MPAPQEKFLGGRIYDFLLKTTTVNVEYFIQKAFNVFYINRNDR